MTAKDSKYKDIGGMSFQELQNLAKNKKLKTTDEWEKVRRRLRHE